MTPRLLAGLSEWQCDLCTRVAQKLNLETLKQSPCGSEAPFQVKVANSRYTVCYACRFRFVLTCAHLVTTCSRHSGFRPDSRDLHGEWRATVIL